MYLIRKLLPLRSPLLVYDTWYLSRNLVYQVLLSVERWNTCHAPEIKQSSSYIHVIKDGIATKTIKGDELVREQSD